LQSIAAAEEEPPPQQQRQLAGKKCKAGCTATGMMEGHRALDLCV
jgi:hypothetical protein